MRSYYCAVRMGDQDELLIWSEMVTDYLEDFESGFLAGKSRMGEAETDIHYFKGEDANMTIRGVDRGIEFVEEFGIGIEADANTMDENNWKFCF